MPVRQRILDFPLRKSSQRTTPSHVGSSLAPSPSSRTRSSRLRSSSKSEKGNGSIESVLKSPHKRKPTDCSDIEEDLRSPAKSPRKSNALEVVVLPSRTKVSPLKLKAFGKISYSAIRNTKAKEQAIQDILTLDCEDESSSDEEIRTKRATGDVTFPVVVENEDILLNLEEKKVSKTPSPSLLLQQKRSPLQNLNVCLDRSRLELRLESIKNKIMHVPSDRSVENKENISPTLRTRTASPSSSFRFNNSCENCPMKSSVRSVHFGDSPEHRTEPNSGRLPVGIEATDSAFSTRTTPTKPGAKPVHDFSTLLSTCTVDANNSDTPLKKKGIRSDSSSSPVNGATNVTPQKTILPLDSNVSCQNEVTVDLLHQILASPVKVTLKKLNPSTLQAFQRKSPLKKVQDAECNVRNVRRSPRKHRVSPASKSGGTPSQILVSPMRSLELSADRPGIMMLYKPDMRHHEAVRQALSQHHGEMVGREKEVGVMTDFLLSHCKQKRSGAMYISGAPGTGKTASLTQILKTLPELEDVSPVWVNCMGLHSSTAVYGRIAKELRVPVLSSELKTVRAIEKHLTKKGALILMVLDEVDQLETRQQDVLYTLFEWPALEQSRLLLLTIANRLDLTERVLPRLMVGVGGSCAPHRLHFPPYTKKQIVDIITARLDKSGVDWKDVVRPAALQLLAGKIANVAGDARRALDVCRRAVEICMSRVATQTMLVTGDKDVPFPKAAVVDMATIMNLFNEVYGSRVVNAITAAPATFPLQQKILLCTMLLVQKHAKNKEISLGKLEEVYRRVCSNRSVPMADSSEFRAICSLLQTRAMIDIGKSKDARLAKVSLRLDIEETERALADRDLLYQILQDRDALGKLAKKIA